MPEKAARTVLAFDYGSKRIGVAVGEPELRTAHPLPGIAVTGDARFAAIGRLVAEWKPARLVVGLPLAGNGSAHETTQRAERFARQLHGRFRVPVELVDERFTSVEAEHRLRGRRAPRLAIDSVAAQLILEQYFDEHAA
ncbi:MAG: Holliday junction resolvase RuvX [Betaproteobacteria bacterium]|nr:MAG: Holliday junction resolvase RuvX [Betaproteobacteria bacterium]